MMACQATVVFGLLFFSSIETAAGATAAAVTAAAVASTQSRLRAEKAIECIHVQACQK